MTRAATATFSAISALFYSVSSRELYVDVAYRWRVKTFVFLLSLLALILLGFSWLPAVPGVRSAWEEFLANEGKAIIDQIPPITITNGRVSTDVDQPYFIRTPDTDEVLAIIDTTGTITSLDGTTAIILLTDWLFILKGDDETRIHDLSEVEEFYLDGPLVERWLHRIAAWRFVLPVLVIASFAYRFLQILFYSVFGMLIAGGMACGLSYGAVLRVTAVAIIPSVLVKTLLSTLGLSIPLSWLAFFLMTLGYLFFALSSIKSASFHDPDGTHRDSFADV
jgi:hypothetical protein